jgi:hypothetical protein
LSEKTGTANILALNIKVLPERQTPSEGRYNMRKRRQKEKQQRPLYLNGLFGMGGSKFFTRYIAISKDNWDKYIKIHPLIRWWMKYLSLPVLGPLMRRLSVMDGRDNPTQAHIFPINRNLNYDGKAESTTMPVDLVRKAAQDASFRAIKHNCFCRDGLQCQKYPIDLGCLMIGEGCRCMVERGTAREATEEEALAHIERAAELGLVCLTMWVGMEMVMLGVPEERRDQVLEICFCCPCCCQGLRSFKYYDRRFMSRFRSIGWTPAASEDCLACGACEALCQIGRAHV